MPSPSRGGGPAATPKYQRIAAALRRELDRTAHTPGTRLPSERSLAARYQVNRQTIRAALQHLREDGLIVTGRRGTRSAFPAPSPPAPSPGPPAAPRALAQSAPRPERTAAAGPARTPAAAIESRLTLVTVAPSLAALLDMRGGDRTLVHHHRELGPGGEVLRHAVTYLCPSAVAAAPELARYRDRDRDRRGGSASAGVRDEDLGPLHQWLERAASDGRVAETITMTRTSHPRTATSVAGLSVRRTLHDTAGRLLAVTDLAFPTWDRLTFHRDRSAPGFLVT
ncbi:GntR family transcriptional regulator [Streptomyces sp. NPDC091268]|uniref:GntR family transcriptional regulator n=1 Tax=Streptomyces sp. NPDC091268 TaxID=3365979 RepID=UPI0038272413